MALAPVTTAYALVRFLIGTPEVWILLTPIVILALSAKKSARRGPRRGEGSRDRVNDCAHCAHCGRNLRTS